MLFFSKLQNKKKENTNCQNSGLVQFTNEDLAMLLPLLSMFISNNNTNEVERKQKRKVEKADKPETTRTLLSYKMKKPQDKSCQDSKPVQFTNEDLALIRTLLGIKGSTCVEMQSTRDIPSFYYQFDIKLQDAREDLDKGIRSIEHLTALLSLSPAKLGDLQELDLSYYTIDLVISRGQFDQLCSNIAQCLRLLKINLQENILFKLKQNEIHVLFAALAKCPLQEINLSENRFNELDPEGFHELFAGLAKCRSLQKLDLSRNRLHILKGELLEHLCTVLCEDLTNLQELNLQCDLDPRDKATSAQQAQWLHIIETVNQSRIESNRKKVITAILCLKYRGKDTPTITTIIALPKELVEAILVQADLAKRQDGKVRVSAVPLRLTLV